MACSIALSSVERIYVHVGTRSPAMAEWEGLRILVNRSAVC